VETYPDPGQETAPCTAKGPETLGNTGFPSFTAIAALL
jgi:hypothetical protein